MLNEGRIALPYSPYSSFCDTFEIAEEIQAIEGYGQSDPDNLNEYNYIDCKRKVFVACGHLNANGNWERYIIPVETDISHYLPYDSFIKVENGIVIRALNDKNKPIPTSITYLLKEGSI
jgi:hypothetical protein